MEIRRKRKENRHKRNGRRNGGFVYFEWSRDMKTMAIFVYPPHIYCGVERLARSTVHRSTLVGVGSELLSHTSIITFKSHR